MNALERYNNQDENNATMQKPFETKSGLYVWKINYIDHNNVYKELSGSIHLIR